MKENSFETSHYKLKMQNGNNETICSKKTYAKNKIQIK